MKPSLVAVVCGLMLLLTSSARGQNRTLPLRPPDRSSPRATLQTFLESCDQVGEFLSAEFRAAPSRAGFAHLLALAQTPIECLDLSATPAAARPETGAAATLALYETLSRLELPPWEQIPGANDLKTPAGEAPRWVIPNTRIALVRLASGPQSGEFVFSAHTVADAEDYYRRTRHLPYLRRVPLANPYEMAVTGGGWLIPYTWLERLPAWLRAPLAGDAVWKWLALGLVLLTLAASLRPVYRLSRRGGDERPLLQSLLRLILPIYVLLVTPVVAYLALVQINVRGHAGVVVELAATAIVYLCAAGLSWRVSAVLAESILTSPRIKPQSVDANLTRLCARLLGLSAAVTFLIVGADKVGVPVYGLIAGLGIGGLAIALAAQPTIENLIGGLNIFADRPIRVGHLCKYGTDVGTVEEIGIRSTRIRGADHTLATVPNGMLSKMSIVNLTQRDRMLIRTVLSLPGDARDRVRYVLAAVQEMLLAHPRIHGPSARARLTGFTGAASEIEVFAYVVTRDPEEFLAVQQEVLLRIMDILEASKVPPPAPPVNANAAASVPAVANLPH